MSSWKYLGLLLLCASIVWAQDGGEGVADVEPPAPANEELSDEAPLDIGDVPDEVPEQTQTGAPEETPDEPLEEIPEISEEEESSDSSDEEPEVEPQPEEPVEVVVPNKPELMEVPAWSYNGEFPPERWAEIYNSCRSDRLNQSPIDIDNTITIFTDELLPISFNENINRLHTSSLIKNTGYTVVMFVPHEAYLASGGDLSHGYRVAGVRFSWADENTRGSEHTINGDRYALEMQIVAYDTEAYATAEDAVIGQDSLAVFSVLFQISEEDNPTLQPIVKGLPNIRTAGTETTTKRHISVTSLLPTDTKRYFSYRGSMTVPPCSSNTDWNVFQQIQPISVEQLHEFRQLEGPSEEDTNAGPITHNARDVKPVGDRVVYRSFLLKSETSRQEVVPESSQGGATAQTASIAALLSLLFVLLL